MTRTSSSAIEPYQTLFARYLDNTDGKDAVAEALASHARALGRPRILDVGAGPGTIATRLLDEAEHVTVVEPSPDFAGTHESRASGRYRFFQQTIQEFEAPSGSFDLIVLSYVLESIPGRDWSAVLAKLDELRSDRGVILGVTYVDGCAWEAFADFVDTTIGASGAREGGTDRIIRQLRDLGYAPVIDRVLETSIWGRDVDELFDVLEFFFRNEADKYESARPRLLKELARLSKVTRSRVSLPVLEAVFQVRS
ncbi:MAG TPA: class I SAM-dependent methyltransferase [Actinomycetota bacterium]|nr:class I SAM-dependent methyltransferase [Actinomycetota bacterium]